MMQPTARNCRTTADPGSEVNASNGSLWSEVCRFYGKYLFNISKSNSSGTGGQAYLIMVSNHSRRNPALTPNVVLTISAAKFTPLCAAFLRNRKKLQKI
jgi:hypothetical protein